MAAAENLGKADMAGKVHLYSPAVVALLHWKTSKFNDKNANVMKGCFQGLASLAAQSTKESAFDKSAAKFALSFAADKMADKKVAVAIKAMLSALAESISPAFVVKELTAGLSGVKAVGAHSEAVPWICDLVKDFGVTACGEKVFYRLHFGH